MWREDVHIFDIMFWKKVGDIGGRVFLVPDAKKSPILASVDLGIRHNICLNSKATNTVRVVVIFEIFYI